VEISLEVAFKIPTFEIGIKTTIMKNYSITILLILLSLQWANAQTFGVNTTTPDPSAQLDVYSIDKGFLLPRLTTAQRDSITNPALSLMVFNMTDSCLQIFMGTAWYNLVCASDPNCTIPTPTTVSAATNTTDSSFTANWSAVSGATEYYLDVATDSGFTALLSGYSQLNVGDTTAYTIAGLACDSLYYIRVQAGNACGKSISSNTVAITTTACALVSGCFAIGGVGYDYGRSIVQTTDGGYVVAGYTNSYGVGNRDVFIIKMDNTGNISWTRTVGGSGNDYGYSIIQTTDGGYVVAGNTNSYGAGNDDIYIIKLDNTGNVSWTRTVGGSLNDYSYSIVQTTDGGYVVAGNTGSYGAGGNDVYIIKLDNMGNVSWTRTVGGSSNDYGSSIVQTTDGGFVVAGITNSYGAGNQDVYIIKLDNTGNVSWTRTVGGSDYDRGLSIVQTNDGGYVVAGYTGSYGAGNQDVYIIKLGNTGNVSWTRTVGGSSYEQGNSIVQTTDGGYVVAGVTLSYGAGYYDVYIIKLDNAGNVSWTRTVGGSFSDYGNSIVQTTDGGYAVVGETYSYGAGGVDVYIIKLDSLGNACATCNPGSGGASGTGGIYSSGGTAGSGGVSGTGGLSGSGGVKTNICQ